MIHLMLYYELNVVYPIDLVENYFHQPVNLRMILNRNDFVHVEPELELVLMVTFEMLVLEEIVLVAV